MICADPSTWPAGTKLTSTSPIVTLLPGQAVRARFPGAGPTTVDR